MATLKHFTRAPLYASLLRPLSTRSYSCSINTPLKALGQFLNLNPSHSLALRQPLALGLGMSTDATTSSSQKPPKKKPRTIKVTFVERDGEEITVDAKIGDTLLEVAKEYDIDLEGACEGTLSCSTCHLIVDKDWYEKIPDFLTEEEQDMLDLAFGLTDTSRLGCQIVVSDAINGIRLKVPTETRDIRNL